MLCNYSVLAVFQSLDIVIIIYYNKKYVYKIKQIFWSIGTIFLSIDILNIEISLFRKYLTTQFKFFRK